MLAADYHNDAGRVEGSFLDAGRYHLVIALRRAMRRGDTLAFRVYRQAIASFATAIGRMETTIDHPVQRLSRTIRFPQARPCRSAVLETGNRRVRLPILRRAGGQTMVRVTITAPRPNVPYTVRWTW